jgi:hypothetical protein
MSAHFLLNPLQFISLLHVGSTYMLPQNGATEERHELEDAEHQAVLTGRDAFSLCLQQSDTRKALETVFTH